MRQLRAHCRGGVTSSKPSRAYHVSLLCDVYNYRAFQCALCEQMKFFTSRREGHDKISVAMFAGALLVAHMFTLVAAKTALVLGSGGLVGMGLVEQLYLRGWEVLEVSKSEAIDG